MVKRKGVQVIEKNCLRATVLILYVSNVVANVSKNLSDRQAASSTAL